MELSLSASLVERRDEHLEASRQPLKSDISRMPGRSHHRSPSVTTCHHRHRQWHLVGRKLRQSCPNLNDANDLRFIEICPSPVWFSACCCMFCPCSILLIFSDIPGLMASRDAWEECAPAPHSARESSANSVDTS